MHKSVNILGEGSKYSLTSAHALGRTRRPMRPASLALRTFSNNGTILQFELIDNRSRKSILVKCMSMKLRHKDHDYHLTLKE